jgi:tRNA dimethylallyltransferase
MSEISARGKTPLLVGGTMLYFKTLLEGLADLPKACPKTRMDIDLQADAQGWPVVHAELAQVDPITAARLHPTDSQRIQRALEVFRLAGRPMSALFAESQQQSPPYDFLSLGLLPSDRSVLHARIAERFDAMLDAGLVDEVVELRAKYHLHLNLPSMRCVGYRQVWEALDGIIPRTEMRDRGIFATRQLAKRQITWLSNTLKPEVFDCLAPNLLDQIKLGVTTFLA